MSSVSVATLKTYFNTGDKPTEANFIDVFDSMLNLADGGTVAGTTTFSAATINTGMQRLSTDAILTIAATTDLVVFAHAASGTSRIITMPAATAGRRLKIVWEVEQSAGDRVLTAAGSDDFTGQISCHVEGNGAGDGDVLSVTDGTVAITFVDDINIGSEVNCYCAVAGAWIITGLVTYDAVGSIPTIA